jgi:hypothetical protein
MNPGIPGANGSVSAAVVDASGNLYAAGGFSLVGDTLAHNVAKWDGSHWSALGSGLNQVNVLAVSGTNVYAGGGTNIAKWDGSSWTEMGAESGNVSALTASGSDIYAVVGGTNVAKWDGSGWSPLGSGMDCVVYALAVSGTDLYAGGCFWTADGNPANNIAKWDGSSWSAVGAGMDDAVVALAVSGSDVYAGGLFTTADGVPVNNIAKWDGSSWSALGLGTGGGSYNPVVRALAVSGSDVYVGGDFTTAGGRTANYIAKWNGTSWSALGSGIGPQLTDGNQLVVVALAASGSNIYAAGAFTAAGGTTANYIAKWNGSSWSALGSGMNATVSAFAVSSSNIYVGGSFSTAADGIPANSIAKWNGSSWSALGSGMGGIIYAIQNGILIEPVVAALTVAGSNVYAGGLFGSAGGSPANSIAKWDGSSWSALGSGMGGGNGFSSVYALTVLGGTLYAGGNFSTAGGNAANYIAQWDGSSWSALGSGMGGGNGLYPYVNALAVSGGRVYAGGAFFTAGGTVANYIAQWDGSSWSALGSGLNGVVSALAGAGNDLYVGGQFTSAGGVSATNVAKWDGANWSALGSGIGGSNPWVSALLVSGGNLYVGGSFTNSGGSVANFVTKWDGTNWSALGSGLNDRVNALAVSGNNLFVGGDFTMAGGKISPFIARAYLLTLPAQLTILPDASGGYFIDVHGAPNLLYSLQRAPSLTGPWATSAPQTADSNGLIIFHDLFPPPARAFYRTVQQQ